ncbi:MAG: hypothetical protein ACRDFW_08000 [bacterium]
MEVFPYQNDLARNKLNAERVAATGKVTTMARRACAAPLPASVATPFGDVVGAVGPGQGQPQDHDDTTASIVLSR